MRLLAEFRTIVGKGLAARERQGEYLDVMPITVARTLNRGSKMFLPAAESAFRLRLPQDV